MKFARFGLVGGFALALLLTPLLTSCAKGQVTVTYTASLTGPYPVSGTTSQKVPYSTCQEWFTHHSGVDVTIGGQKLGVANGLSAPGTDSNNDLELSVATPDPEAGQFAGPSSETVDANYSGTFHFDGKYQNAGSQVENGTLSWTCA